MNAEFSSQAEQFLNQLYDYYADNGGTRLADRMLAEIFDAIQKIVEKPGIGILREDFTDRPFRFYRVRNHYLIYDPATSPIYVARIYHATQDIKNRMKRP